MKVTVVGIDVLFRVQSRDLMSLKLQQGKVLLEQRPITPASGEHARGGLGAPGQAARSKQLRGGVRVWGREDQIGE